MLLQHGSYRVGIDGSILFFQAFGSWNKESSSNCTRKIRDIIDSLEGMKFGVLIDSIDFEGVTEDGYSDWYNAIRYWIKTDLSTVVRVDDISSVHYKVFLKPFDRMFRELTVFRNMISITEALEFLWSHDLNGFETGLTSTTAQGPEGENLPFRIR